MYRGLRRYLSTFLLAGFLFFSHRSTLISQILTFISIIIIFIFICKLLTEYYDFKKWTINNWSHICDSQVLIRFSGPADTSVFVRGNKLTKIQGK